MQKYFSNFASLLSSIYYLVIVVIIEYYLSIFFAYEPQDKTYGRSKLSLNPVEVVVRQPPYETSEEYVPINNTTPTEGNIVYYQTWVKTGTVPVGELVYVHGINDYGGKFAAWALPFLEKGFRVHSLDHIGHGRSNGVHGYFESMDTLVNALHAVIGSIKSKQKFKVPLFLLGMSMGGQIILRYSLEYRSQVEGLVMLCPAIYVSEKTKPGPLLISVAKFIKNVFPRLPIAAANRGKSCSDPKVEEAFVNDPLTYSGMLRIATGLALLESMDYVIERLDKIQVPFLLFHGNCDRVCDIYGSIQLYDKSSSADKTFRVIEGSEHDLLNDKPEIGRALMAEAVEWIYERATRGKYFLRKRNK